MPIGNSYPRDVVIRDADLFLGTKASLNNTVNYTAQGIANYLNINGKVSISGQMVFKFVEANGFSGTISFDGGSGNNTPFSNISQLIVSIMDMSEQEVNAFLAYLTGKEILLAEQNKINLFGNYKIIGYAVTVDPNFYTLDLEYIGGNGTILKDKYYDLVAFSSSAGGTPSPLTTKGDLYTFNSGDTRLPIGLNSQVLTVDTSTSVGLKWSAPSSTGITSINSLTGASQVITTGTTGTNFTVNSTGTTHTLNLPVASSINTGKLSSTDWTTFNNKQVALGFTPIRSFFSGTNGILVANTLTITPTFTRLIPANTFLANDVVELLFRAFTIDIAKTSPTALYIYINTTNSLSSGSPIQTAFFQSTVRTMQMTRTLAIKGATTRVTTVTGNASADSTLTGTSSLLTIDWSVDQYFIFAIGNTVAAPTENLTGDCFRIIKN